MDVQHCQHRWISEDIDSGEPLHLARIARSKAVVSVGKDVKLLWMVVKGWQMMSSSSLLATDDGSSGLFFFSALFLLPFLDIANILAVNQSEGSCPICMEWLNRQVGGWG